MTDRSIVFLNRFYWPDISATAQMLTDLAEELAARGWAVTVVASNAAYDRQSVELPKEERHKGVHIVRVRGTRLGRHRLATRMFDYGSYYVGALFRTLRLKKQDVVAAMSDPPFILAVALAAAKLRGARSVYWVQDLFPQIASKLGVLDARRPVYRIAERIAHWLHARCDLVITLGPRMAEMLVQTSARPERTTFVHNWADAVAIRSIPTDENGFVAENGLRDKFVVLYSGNAGRAHTFEAVLHAARAFRDNAQIVFLFVGGGARIPELKAAAASEGLANVRFLDYVPRRRLAESLSAASVSLVTENPDVVGLLVPSKAYGILASGRPLVFVGSDDSDVARVVRDADCGVVISPDDGAALVRCIERLVGDHREVARLGANARRAAEQCYDKLHAVQQWQAAVERVIATRPSNLA